MATYQRKLVHKQFNSPIGLYSENNVKATLDRELKVLSNGSMGIDFDDSTKPTNLANSAVLRMLEEEEQEKRQRQSGVKRVIWPPEQSPSRSSSQPPRAQPSPARDNPQYYQDTLAQHPQSYDQTTVSHKHHQQGQHQQQHQHQPNYISNPPVQHYNQNVPQEHTYPIKQNQDYYQYPQSNQSFQSYQQHQLPQSTYEQSKFENQFNKNAYPIQQCQNENSVQTQSINQQDHRSHVTPSRTFPNPDPSFLHINTPEYFRACNEQEKNPSTQRNRSPCTAAFTGGIPQIKSQNQSSSFASHDRIPDKFSTGISSIPLLPSSNVNPTTQPSDPFVRQSSNNLPGRIPYNTESYSEEYMADRTRTLIHQSYSPNYHHDPSIIAENPPTSSITYSQSPSRWSHVKSPIRQPQIQNYAQNHQQIPYAYAYGDQSYSGDHQQRIDYQQQSLDEQHYQSQSTVNPQELDQQYQQQQQQSFYRQPSPGVITLRDKAPFNQQSPPVFASQPAAASFGGGINMRGDQKWPPQEYKKQSEIENDARRKIALGPAFRPRRVQKDYTEFFSQNALNSTYPGYRAPPGTQHHGGR